MGSAAEAYERYMEEEHSGILRELKPISYAAEDLAKVVRRGVSPKTAWAGMADYDQVYGQVMRKLGAPHLSSFGGTPSAERSPLDYYDRRIEAIAAEFHQEKAILRWYERDVLQPLLGPRAWFEEHGGESNWYQDLYELGGNLRPVGGPNKIWSEETIAKLYSWMEAFPIKTGGDIRSTLQLLRDALPQWSASLVDDWLADLAREGAGQGAGR
jgi:hypothetical protein